jgi:prephenate dehydratase
MRPAARTSHGIAADATGSARKVAELGDRSRAAIASHLAPQSYGLEIILAEYIEDEAHNTTLFIVLASELC